MTTVPASTPTCHPEDSGRSEGNAKLPLLLPPDVYRRRRLCMPHVPAITCSERGFSPRERCQGFAECSAAI